MKVVDINFANLYWSIYKELLIPLGIAFNLTSDAHLAALAIEHGARFYSTDNGQRFQSFSIVAMD
jgi:predicted nucleic acid-binding protein